MYGDNWVAAFDVMALLAVPLESLACSTEKSTVAELPNVPAKPIARTELNLVMSHQSLVTVDAVVTSGSIVASTATISDGSLLIFNYSNSIRIRREWQA